MQQQRFEEAATIRRRLETLLRTGARFHRVRSLAGCPEIVGARREGPDWEIHVIRYGRLAGTGVATPNEVPQAVARAVRAGAETVIRPPDPLPAAGSGSGGLSTVSAVARTARATACGTSCGLATPVPESRP